MAACLQIHRSTLASIHSPSSKQRGFRYVLILATTLVLSHCSMIASKGSLGENHCCTYAWSLPQQGHIKRGTSGLVLIWSSMTTTALLYTRNWRTGSRHDISLGLLRIAQRSPIQNLGMTQTPKMSKRTEGATGLDLLPHSPL